MPKKLEHELREEVERKYPNWSQKRKDAYVYGTLRSTGWKPKRETR
jgi:hypothetical protein